MYLYVMKNKITIENLHTNECNLGNTTFNRQNMNKEHKIKILQKNRKI